MNSIWFSMVYVLMSVTTEQPLVINHTSFMQNQLWFRILGTGQRCRHHEGRAAGRRSDEPVI